MSAIECFIRRLKFEFCKTLVCFLCIVTKAMGRSIVSFIAHPIFMLAVVFAQLILGALLGIQLTNIDFNSLENTEFREWLVVSWSNINGNVQIFIISVFVLSIVKAICDAIKAYLTRIHEKEKLKRASLIPSNQWFSSSYLDTVRDVLNDRYMIDNGQKAPLKVIQDSLTKLRNLASEYDYLSTDTISINLMIVMRADESKKVIEKNWDKCCMFFDGANAQSAFSQIDGVLTPMAVAHKNQDAKLYIGENRPKNNPLLLPIVDELNSDSRTKQRVIGAPKAFSTGQFQYYPNFLKCVEQWLYKEQKRYISSEQADLLYQYYVNDGSARSLLSVPVAALYEKVDEQQIDVDDRQYELIEEEYKDHHSSEQNETLEIDVNFDGDENEGEEVQQEGDSDEKPILLVLNIYAQHEDLLRGNPSLFISLTQPIVDTISYAFDAWILSLEAK